MRGEGGANAVEFALLLPVFVLLLFGTIYAGALLSQQQTATQAAREGARYAATLPLPPAAGTPTFADWGQQVVARVDSSMSSDLMPTGQQPYVCVRYVPASGTPQVHQRGTGSCTVGSTTVVAGQRVEVVVQRQSRIELVVFPQLPVTVSGISIARYEG